MNKTTSIISEGKAKIKVHLEEKITKTALIPNLKVGVFNREVFGTIEKHRFSGPKNPAGFLWIKNCRTNVRGIKPQQFLISKKLPVFYNPSLEFNRELSVLILKALNKKQMQIALPLAASGVRGVRLMLELPKNSVKNLYMNDYSDKAVKLMKENLKLNDLNKDKRINISKKDANLFLLEGKGFDYIDIDPFGSPNPFLDSACKRLSREGILAITATDTSLLSGTYREACIRNYYAVPLRNELKHEIGIRILIRRVQMISAQYEKALTPIFSLSHEHYMRVFFVCKKSKKCTDDIFKQHKYMMYCAKCGNFTVKGHNEEYCSSKKKILMKSSGPLWTGQLYEKELIKKLGKSKSQKKLLDTIKEESRFDRIGFYDVHSIAEKHKMALPTMDEIFNKVKGCRTHFTPYGIKTNLPFGEFIEILRLIKTK